MNLRYENRLIDKGSVVAGLDEVGRGAWAGPLVAGCVVIDRKISLRSKPGALIRGIKDSKQLTPLQRERFFGLIADNFIWSVGIVSNKEIDALGVGRANVLAFKRAVARLTSPPDYLLVDYFSDIGLDIKTKGIKDGDNKVLLIAAASIVAKIYRDRLMIKKHKEFSKWRFDLHKGYGTKLHRDNLKKYGVSNIHRKSFFPVKEVI